MKKYLLKISVVLIAILTLQFCTEKEDSTINQVLDGVTSGGILRTIAETQKTFNFFSTASKWSVLVEAQDASSGQLLKEVRLYSKHTKGTVTSAERIVKSFPASTFKVAGARNLPQGVIECSLAEVLTALTIPAGGYTAADKFTMRLEYVMTDGRTFSITSTSTPVTNGYFNSPFQYSVQFFCPLVNAADFNGNYKVTADAWEDYAIGATIPVVYNAADGTYTFRISNANNVYIRNRTSSFVVTINPATGTATGRSSEGLDYIGTSAVTNVAITGSVGTCTADINLLLTFSGGYNGANQSFKLVKI